MKETNLGLMAYDLLDAATALAGILDQNVESNCIKVNYRYASQLITNMLLSARAVADELTFIEEEGGVRP